MQSFLSVFLGKSFSLPIPIDTTLTLLFFFWMTDLTLTLVYTIRIDTYHVWYGITNTYNSIIPSTNLMPAEFCTKLHGHYIQIVYRYSSKALSGIVETNLSDAGVLPAAHFTHHFHSYVKFDKNKSFAVFQSICSHHITIKFCTTHDSYLEWPLSYNFNESKIKSSMVLWCK